MIFINDSLPHQPSICTIYDPEISGLDTLKPTMLNLICLPRDTHFTIEQAIMFIIPYFIVEYPIVQ